MDRNRFRADTSRYWEEFICKVLTKFLQCFGGDAITVKIKDGRRRPYLSTDQNHIRRTQLDHLGNNSGKFKKIQLVVSEEMRWEKVYGRMDVWTDGHRMVPVWVKLGRANTTMENSWLIWLDWAYTYIISLLTLREKQYDLYDHIFSFFFAISSILTSSSPMTTSLLPWHNK